MFMLPAWSWLEFGTHTLPLNVPKPIDVEAHNVGARSSTQNVHVKHPEFAEFAAETDFGLDLMSVNKHWMTRLSMSLRLQSSQLMMMSL